MQDKAVYCFAEDDLGFIWMGTISGLYRFDGYNFKHFESPLDDENFQISYGLRNMIYDHHLNRLWLISSNDMQYFDLNTYTFYPWNLRNVQLNNKTLQPVQLDYKNIYLNSVNGLIKYNIESESHTIIFHSKPEQSHELYAFNDVRHKYKNELLLLKSNRLYIFNTESKTYHEIKLKFSYYNSVCYDEKREKIYLSSNSGISVLDKNGNNEKLISGVSLTHGIITMLSSNTLSLSGVYFLDLDSYKVDSTRYDKGIYDNQLLFVNSQFVDSNGNLWRGSYESGFNILPNNNLRVINYPMVDKVNLEVYDIEQIKGREKLLVTGNPLNGIVVLNLDSGDRKIVKKSIDAESNYLYSIVSCDEDHNYVTDQKYLYNFISTNETFKKIPILDVIKNNEIIHKLLKRGSDEIIILSSKAIYVLNWKSNKLVRIPLAETIANETNFLPTVADGVSVFFINKQKVYEFTFENKIQIIEIADLYDKIPNLKISDLYVENENIWLSTENYGLFQFNKNKNLLSHFHNDNHNLKSDYLNSLAKFGKEELFLGGASKIYRFNTIKRSHIGVLKQQHGFERDDAAYGIEVLNDQYFVKKNYGSIDVLDLKKWMHKNQIKKPIVTRLKVLNNTINLLPLTKDTSLKLEYNENFIEFQFTSLNFTSSNLDKFQYRLNGVDTSWITTSTPNVQYARLPSGSYTFMVRVVNNDGIYSEVSTKVNFEINRPFYLQWWFIILFISTLCLFFFIVYRQKIEKIRIEERLISNFKTKLAEVENKALRSQMNPHFIFNSLNSIQKFIFDKDEYAASQYLTKFSRLVRMILDHSNQNFIPIENEVQQLALYLELEKMRFSNKFEFTISIDEIINVNWLIPSMVLQPHAENSIWHGLMHKNEHCILKINFSLENNKEIVIKIQDNGVGRERAALLKSSQLNNKKSYGTSITYERLNHINTLYGYSSSFEIIDLYDEKHIAAGTMVKIKLPVIENINLTSDK